MSKLPVSDQNFKNNSCCLLNILCMLGNFYLKKKEKVKILRIFRFSRLLNLRCLAKILLKCSFQVTAIPFLPGIERPLGYRRRHFRHCEEPLRQKESSSLPKASSDRTLEARQEVTPTRALECRT